MGTAHRVIIVDDHTIVRQSLRALLTSQPDFDVVGEAADGFSAIQSVVKLKPDLVLLDVSMPRMAGTEAIRAIREAHSPAKILILTGHMDEEALLAALRAGADGYLVKEAALDELLLAARSVLQGYPFLSPQVCAPLIQGYLTCKSAAGCSDELGTLNDRERTILKLMAEGHGYKNIGEFLCLSVKTVEKAATSLRKKLGISSVQGLTAYAIQRGLVDLGGPSSSPEKKG